MAYGLVPQAIQQTGRTVRDILSHEAAGRVSMARTGLMKERQDYDIREAEYEKYMQAPDTIKNIVNTMNVPEEQKQRFREHSLYKELQDIPTSRTNFFQALQATMAKKKEWAREDETSQQKYHQGLLGTYTPESVQAYVETITDENPSGDVSVLVRPAKEVSPSAQLNQRKLDAWKAYEGGTATPAQIKLIKAGPKHTAAEVIKFADSVGGYDLATPSNRAIIDSMLPGTGLRVVDETVPAERSGFLGLDFLDVGKPNILATTKKVLSFAPKTGLKGRQSGQTGLAPQGTQPVARTDPKTGRIVYEINGLLYDDNKGEVRARTKVPAKPKKLTKAEKAKKKRNALSAHLKQERARYEKKQEPPMIGASAIRGVTGLARRKWKEREKKPLPRPLNLYK